MFFILEKSIIFILLPKILFFHLNTVIFFMFHYNTGHYYNCVKWWRDIQSVTSSSLITNISGDSVRTQSRCGRRRKRGRHIEGDEGSHGYGLPNRETLWRPRLEGQLLVRHFDFQQKALEVEAEVEEQEVRAKRCRCGLFLYIAITFWSWKG